MSSNKFCWILLSILALAGAIVYLPFAAKMGLYKDDWFLIYDAHTQGSQFFHTIYASDRPARASLMEVTYNLFGDHILYYHISAYIYRALAAWAFFWVLEMIWSQNTRQNFLASLLFLLYPGFLSQINPIDYQAQIFSLLLAMASIAFTIKSITSTRINARLAGLGLAIITGILYPALVEYFIGFEVLRLSLIMVLVFREKPMEFKGLIKRITVLCLPFATAPAIFLIWRIFFFENTRRATDVGAQLGQAITSPLAGLWWLVNWMQDIIRVIFLAWSAPLNNLAFSLRLGDFLLGVAISLLVVLISFIGYFVSRFQSSNTNGTAQYSNWHRDMLIVGSISAAFALLPVILANRHADFGDYSRYTLASAVGVGMILATLINLFDSVYWQRTLIGFLIFAASLTHYANAAQAVQETEAVRNFWWQVAWRAPNIKPGTTLVASYAVGAIQEDYYIWGPANLIYSAERQNNMPIEIKIPAAILTDDVVERIMMQRGEESPVRRGNELTRNFGNILLLSQASLNSCLHIVDGNIPEYSISDQQRTMLVGPNSKIDNVLLNENLPVPPAAIFGNEPIHDWCYYYQKASLARQDSQWETIAKLGDEAQKLGLHPNDQIEWLPFLQAYAILGDRKQVKSISTRINTEPFYTYETCKVLTSIRESGAQFSSEIQTDIAELFCK